MDLYPRENYLRKIRGFYHDVDLIKVITGVRRCGKSSLMKTIAGELSIQGIRKENLIFIDLDSREYRHVHTADQLDQLLSGLDSIQGVKYLFVDEVQNVSGFEQVLNAFREDGHYSIFITGSNSYLLSGELITKLTGRYLEIEMGTLTFEEYLGMKKFYDISISPNLTEELNQYLYEGGFPKTLFYPNQTDKRSYVNGIISEILKKDIQHRVRISNKGLFDKVQTYLINNYGSTMSLNNILVELKKDGIYLKRETLNRYINVLKDAKIIYECNRFDLKSKKSLRSEQKYYLADISFYMANHTDNRIHYGPALENIVYQYARSKGYAISIGKIGKTECDFILRDSNQDYRYVQVAMTVMVSKETEEREYRPLEMISDNYPKYVLTLNDLIQKRNGIIQRNIPEFLASGDLF